MEQKDIIIVIMFILIIYCIYQINNLKENFDLTSDSNFGFIQIGNWFIQDRGDGLVFMRGSRTDGSTKMVIWSNNNPGAPNQVGLLVPEIQIGNGGPKTWRINTNEQGSLMFNTDNTHKWIDFNSNLHMVGDKGIHFNGLWTFKRNVTNNNWLSLYYNNDNMIDFKDNDNNWSRKYWS